MKILGILCLYFSEFHCSLVFATFAKGENCPPLIIGRHLSSGEKKEEGSYSVVLGRSIREWGKRGRKKQDVGSERDERICQIIPHT